MIQECLNDTFLLQLLILCQIMVILCCFLLDYINLLSPNEYEKNDKIILKFCQ